MSGESSLLFQRVSSFALQFSGLSMVTLLLIPFIAWRLYQARRWARYGEGVVLVGLLLCLIYTESRIAYLAFAVGFTIFVVMTVGLFRPANRFLLVALVALAIILVVGAGYLDFSEFARALRAATLEWRPGSWLTRFRVYQETLRLLPEHPVAGWGIPVQIPGMQSVYSAGTHSSYLGMLFQHGMIGLVLYLGLWISIWQRILKGLREGAIPLSSRLFWAMAAVSMLSFNIREAADTWWWDQLLTMTAWTMWGLILAVPKFFRGGGGVNASQQQGLFPTTASFQTEKTRSFSEGVSTNARRSHS
jgi:O-antigen ligase